MNIYHDLCLEIEAYELRCEQLEKEGTQIFNLMNRGPKTKLVATWSDMPNGGSDDTPMDKLYVRWLEVERLLNVERDILTDKKGARRQLEDKMSEFQTLDYKVAYMRDIEHLDLITISNKLNYSYDHIKRISAKTSRMREKELLKA